MKTAELTGVALDWAVAKCEGYIATIKPNEIIYTHPISGEWHYNGNWKPAENWSQGGPIIERETINLHHFNLDELGNERSSWGAYKFDDTEYFGTTPLEASMRCYVASKLGVEIEIPEELL